MVNYWNIYLKCLKLNSGSTGSTGSTPCVQYGSFRKMNVSPPACRTKLRREAQALFHCTRPGIHTSVCSNDFFFSRSPSQAPYGAHRRAPKGRPTRPPPRSPPPRIPPSRLSPGLRLYRGSVVCVECLIGKHSQADCLACTS